MDWIQQDQINGAVLVMLKIVGRPILSHSSFWRYGVVNRKKKRSSSLKLPINRNFLEALERNSCHLFDSR